MKPTTSDIERLTAEVATAHSEAARAHELLSAEQGRNKEAAAKAQDFFASLHSETQKPHFGLAAKDITRDLIRRAEEAGLYTPGAI